MHNLPTDDQVTRIVQMLCVGVSTAYTYWAHRRVNTVKQEVKQIKDACTFPACGHVCEVPNDANSVLQRS